MAGRLAGKTAIVTGASRGIGQAMGVAFCEEGATVVITSRKQEGLDVAAAAIRDAVPGANVIPKACHAGKPQDIQAFFEWMDSEVGIADVLVNNAATNPYFGPMMSIEDFGAWDKTFEVNVKGQFLMAQAVCKRLLSAERGGSVIFTSSVYGLRGAPFQGIYAMTKASLVSMTKTLALELGGAGIRVNAIAPGLIDTRMASAITSSDALTSVFTDRAGLKRVGQPREVANVALFLASDEASYVTGQTMVVDAGFLAG